MLWLFLFPDFKLPCCCNPEDKIVLFSLNKPINMKKLIPSRFAEIIFALVMGAFAAIHLKYGGSSSGAVPSYFPGDDPVWMYITGTGLALAAIAILLNKFKRPACYLLAAMLLVFIFTIHLPASLKGASHYQLLKDVGLAMAAIIIGNGCKSK